MSGPYSQEQYERAKNALATGGLPSDKVPVVKSRVAQYENDRARGYLPAPGARDQSAMEPLKERPAPAMPAGTHPGSFNMGTASVQDYLWSLADEDPRRREMISKVTAATQDDSLPNASKLKVFNDPTEWEPKAVSNPFSSLPEAPKTPQYFYEPSVEQFQEAIATGALSKQLEKEFPGGAKFGYDPKLLEQSKAFAAYKDAAWRHELANAMKTNTPLVRAAFSPKGKGTGGALVQALDPAVATATGALSGATMGLADPLIRSVAPETAEAERRSRLRNPTADTVGQVLGGLSPMGLPSLAAKGATKVLGAVGLGNKGLSGLAKSTAAGAATGAAEANVRAIAQSAADALDAGDSAVEAARRLYDTLNPQQVYANALQGGGLGAAMGAGGHLVGTVAEGGAKKIVGGDERLPVLVRGQDSGVKMSPVGDPVMTSEMDTAMARGMAKGANADELIANEAIPTLANQRLKEQQAATSRAQSETSAARAKLGEATVDTLPVAEEILATVDAMPAMTPQASAKRTALQRYARKIRSRGQMTAKELDDVISEVDAQANQDAKKPDPDWNKVSAILRKGRDELQFNDPTTVENYAIQDAEGGGRPVSGYGAMKTRQSLEMDQQQFDNRQMGLPPKLAATPQRLGNKSEADAAQYLESRPDFPNVQRYFNQNRAVASDVERSDFARPKDTNRTVDATQDQYAANQALREAVDSGYGYQGKTFRGARMSPEQIQSMVSAGKVKTDSIWSTSKDMEHALSFAKKGDKGEPVLFEVEGASGVSLDQVPGLNTFDEVVVPTGKTFKIVDSYRGEDGILRVKVSDGTRAPDASEVTALAESVEPKASLDADQTQAFQSKLLGVADTKNAIPTEKIFRLAARAGIPEKMELIRGLRASQNWKNLLGRSVAGLARGNGGMAGFIEAQTLRAVPTLKSLSGGLDNPGGLPELSASPKASELVDRFLAKAVPELPEANLRGGQAARPVGSINSRSDKKKLRDDMTEEEAEFALQVIKNILATEGQKLQRAQ
jgi:hypothetical protein